MDANPMREQLLAEFSPSEVATANEMLSCLDGPPRSTKFRRMVMLLLRGHYSSPANYGEEYEHLACFVYGPENTGTLQVALSHQFDDKNPDCFPGIYVGFGGVVSSKLALGNFVGHSSDMASTYLAQAAELTLTVNHVAKNPDDAYDLADMSVMVLEALGAPMAHNSGATSFEVPEYGKPAREIPSPDRYYTVAMSVKIRYNRAVTRTIESHRIRRIVSLVQSD